MAASYVCQFFALCTADVAFTQPAAPFEALTLASEELSRAPLAISVARLRCESLTCRSRRVPATKAIRHSDVNANRMVLAFLFGDECGETSADLLLTISILPGSQTNSQFPILRIIFSDVDGIQGDKSYSRSTPRLQDDRSLLVEL
jgi:hypothetical protein